MAWRAGLMDRSTAIDKLPRTGSDKPRSNDREPGRVPGPRSDRYLVTSPNLITNVATTDASVPDVAMTAPIHAEQTRRQVPPGEHYLDSGYPSADLLVSSLAEYGVRLVTPMLVDTSVRRHSRWGSGGSAASLR